MFSRGSSVESFWRLLGLASRAGDGAESRGRTGGERRGEERRGEERQQQKSSRTLSSPHPSPRTSPHRLSSCQLPISPLSFQPHPAARSRHVVLPPPLRRLAFPSVCAQRLPLPLRFVPILLSLLFLLHLLLLLLFRLLPLLPLLRCVGRGRWTAAERAASPLRRSTAPIEASAADSADSAQSAERTPDWATTTGTGQRSRTRTTGGDQGESRCPVGEEEGGEVEGEAAPVALDGWRVESQ